MVDPSTRLPLKKNRLGSLIAPLLLISIGLHGLLLFSPLPTLPQADSQAEPEEAPPQEDAVVDILSIAAPEGVEPPPTEAAPEAAPLQPAAPTAALPPNPDKLPPPTETPAETAAVEEPFQAEPPPGPTETAFDSAGARSDFVVNLGSIGLNNYTSDLGLPPSNLFRRPENASSFLVNAGSAPTPAAGARDAQWLDKEPDAVLAQLVATYSPSGVNIAELSPYAGERFFAALTPAGQPFLYLSLVQLKGSTLLVIWENPPPGASI